MGNFNKTAMITSIAEHTGLARSDVSRVLDAMTRTIKEQTSQGLIVALPGLGRFEQKTRAAREGRNPATGETIQIQESTYLRFKASKAKS